MKFNGVIENKLRIIEGKVADIESWNIASYNEFKNNSLVQNAVERALQAAVYKDMVRFRNFIVHRYEQIDPEIIYSIASRKLNLFAQFVDEIRSGSGEKGRV